jgi:hypothetical protein
MPTKTLSFTAVQPGTSRRIEFPLHPQTVSADHVGKLLADLLETITEQIGNHSRVSDGDVLQALCMTLAIRMNMVDAPPTTVRTLVSTLLEQADEAVADSTVQAVGNA